MKTQIKSFCAEFDYPKEATDALVDAYMQLKKTEYYPLFQSYVELYNSDDGSFSYNKALKATQLIAEKTEINRYTLDLLLFICMAEHCRELYVQAGISLQIYKDSMTDLRCKLFECHKCFGVWGSFVAPWFSRFFDLSRFALGRLQFEDDPSMERYEKNGVVLNRGDWVLNVHIPSSGKLTVEDCMDSFRRAAEFYADRFPDGIVKFTCHSWLLAPNHKDYLDPNSGIRQFADLFDVVKWEEDPAGRDLWRIFHRNYEGSTEGFPTDTSLQRAYLKLLADGETPQIGLGFLFMKDGKIL